MAIYHTYLSIDPGVSNGIALLDGILVSSCTVNDVDVLHVIMDNEPNVILIEGFPAMGSSDQEHRVRRLIEFCQLIQAEVVAVIQPSQWKPMAKANQWKFSFGKTKHERDAYNMLRWYILTKENLDMGDM